LDPLGTAATDRPIVRALVDYGDAEIDGMIIGRGNQSTRRKSILVSLCPPQTTHAMPGSESRPPQWDTELENIDLYLKNSSAARTNL
jgi:hypothetical protein